MAVHAWLLRHDGTPRCWGPESRFPAVFKLNKPTDKSPLQRFGHIVASVVCHISNRFCKWSKDHYQRGTWAKWHLRFAAILRSSPIQFSFSLSCEEIRCSPRLL